MTTRSRRIARQQHRRLARRPHRSLRTSGHHGDARTSNGSADLSDLEQRADFAPSATALGALAPDRPVCDHDQTALCQLGTATIVCPVDDLLEDAHVFTPSTCLMHASDQCADNSALPTDPVLRRRALEERRVLGAYYTPERLSQLLADWAIQSPDDTVLEPSFGGCGFLSTARDTLARHGCIDPVAQIYGCDIDPVAFEYLENVFGDAADTSGFIMRDFLDCDAIPEWPSAFSVILANPPYIPHHRIGGDRVRELWRRPQGITGVKGRASLWAYFLSHAVSLLQPGGRMAWVLPGAFLQADYAAPIRQYLGRHFERCAAFVIHERLFLTEGADEETVILLADGHRAEPGAGAVEVGEASTLAALDALITQWVGATWVGRTGSFSPATLSLSEETQRLIATLGQRCHAVALGTIAKVQIGLVTGNNKFFVLNQAQRDEAGLAVDDCTRILSKFKAAPGIALLSPDLDRYDKTGGRSFLIASDGATDSEALQAYLATYPLDSRENVSTFKKRSVWSQACDGNLPDAFFPVMHHHGPRLILNPDGLNCTNTIHRVFFRDAPSETVRHLYALSILTTFSQISAELTGRRYGSGVLKHEPRDAERIEIMLPTDADPVALAAAYRQADEALRCGDTEQARRLADAAIWGWSPIQPTDEEAALLDEALMAMRRRRRPNRQLRSTPRSTSAPTQSSR